jgi:long-chain acyl-CoA synthetase
MYVLKEKEAKHVKSHNLLEMLSRTVKRFPERTALSWEENDELHKLSYQRLWNMIRDFAFGLEKIGIRSGAKIAIIAENHPRWVICEFAVLSLGATSVPIHPNRHPDQIRKILRHADATGIITDRYELLEKVKGASNLLQHSILLNGKADGSLGALQFETIIQIGQSIANEEQEWAYPSIQPSDVAIIYYPNDKTKTEKGVLLSHRNILNNLQSFLYVIPYTKHDHLLSVLSLSHPFERIAGYLAPLATGAEITYIARDANWVKASKRIKPTLFSLSPVLVHTIYEYLNKQIQSSPAKKYLFQHALRQAEKIYGLKRKGYNWSVPSSLQLHHSISQTLLFAPLQKQLGGRVRFILSGGAPLNEKVHRFFWCINLPVVESYYLTECASVISATNLSCPQPKTAGKPLPGIELRIQADGELMIKIPQVISGYYKIPLSDTNVYTNGWISTGDHAEMDADGTLHNLRRKVELDPQKAVLPTAVH